MDIRISVALVTRNGPDRLARALGCLRAQTVRPFEVVVSDDSDPDLAADVQKVVSDHEARYIAGPRRGLYANRNHAALACRGTIVRTMDDDHTFPVDHFERCISCLEQDPEAIWTTGEQGIVDGKRGRRSEYATQLHPSGHGCLPEDLDDNWAIADGSTFYPASVFQRGFRMLEEYSYGSSYLEFGAFLRKHGYRSRCIRGVVIEHHLDDAAVTRHLSLEHVSAESCLHASLAYNLYFRPNRARAIRYVASTLWAYRRVPALAGALPRILRGLSQRWGGAVL